MQRAPSLLWGSVLIGLAGCADPVSDDTPRTTLSLGPAIVMGTGQANVMRVEYDESRISAKKLNELAKSTCNTNGFSDAVLTPAPSNDETISIAKITCS